MTWLSTNVKTEPGTVTFGLVAFSVALVVSTGPHLAQLRIVSFKLAITNLKFLQGQG